MKRVWQTTSTCGQACVASIAEVSLEEATSVFGHSKCTHTREVAHALWSFGYKCKARLTMVHGRVIGFKKLPERCIVKVCWYDKHGQRTNKSHWCVVWDCVFHDPSDITMRLGLLPDYRGKVTSYLEVSKV